MKIRFIIMFWGVALLMDAYAQLGVTKSMTDRLNNKLEKEELDHSFIRALYVFTQKVSKEGVSVEVVDSMLLELGENYSLYSDFKQSYNDSVYSSKMGLPTDVKTINIVRDLEAYNSLVEEGGGENIVKPENRSSIKLYKQRKAYEIIMIDEFNMNVYKCTEKIAPQDWNIMADTLTILGYLCQKATCHFRGRNYIAWFSLEIPISEGPWKFYGLPGLILLVEDEERLFQFRVIGIEQLNTPKSLTMDKDEYILCNNKEFIQLWKNKLKNKSMVYRRGGTFYFSVRTNTMKYQTLEINI